MKLPRDLQRLDHIRDYCEDIPETVKRFGDDFDIFISDKDYQKSILMSLAQIGELERGLSDEFKRTIGAGIPWARIRGTRNIIAHRYGDITFEIIWRTIRDDIPTLKAFCDEQLRPYDEDDDEL